MEQAWRFDANGLTPVDRLPELDKSSAIASTTPVISFCLDDMAKRMIYVEWNGLRAGSGAILALQKSGQWTMERHAWIS